jgi:uncharacterized protein YecT (DUF1311 family)
MKAILYLSITIATLFSVPAHGQHMNEKDSPCVDIAITADLTNCLSTASDKADAKLNSVYQEVRKNLEGEELDRLVKTQRLWIQYRDANCAAEQNLYEGGSAKYAVHFACLEAMTRARTRELQITYAVRLK